MFDIGFAEMLLICIVALLVLGPQRLPVVIRQTTLYMGRFKRSYQRIRTELEEEIGMDEIKKQLHDEEIFKSMQDFDDYVDVKKTIDLEMTNPSNVTSTNKAD